ncbi:MULTISPECIES: NAD(P)/FAD-dependent oxidoreductase [unclassified Pseudonocardia]|uniref:flavin-containing monooxygenase n=1 Tax=unclassified Pseudonocardia TaxID=2619320 RepID=UPI0001FFF0C9|nr:NAD(P)/FAD-dependent oxidoreductase [Pseudonocardia sp. Ae707_Ps1]OLM21350.1 Cyclohexanone monooxygenase [Pseudonocardia sp. Ae707_Ps1]
MTSEALRIRRPAEPLAGERVTGPSPRHSRVAVVGAGFTGLAVGLALLRRGVHDFVLLERADDVGGVWRDNTYPGVGVDTPSPLYQLRAMTNPDWSDLYAPGHEVQDYARRLADSTGLLAHIRFGAAVDSARWDAAAARWRIATPLGAFTADVLVSAAGLVADPKQPDVDGLADFPGPVFHSARWDHSADLTGKRVAVVGTGATAIQLIPELQPQVAELHVLQRTPAWILPKPERPVGDLTRRALAANPILSRMQFDLIYVGAELLAATRRSKLLRETLSRVGRRHLGTQVPDPELRDRLTPDFDYACKRPLVSNHYLPAMCASNTTLHTGGLSHVDGGTVVSGDGTAAEVDAIVLTTGFEVGATAPIARRIQDSSGRSLHDHWGSYPRAYLGMNYPGFPNLFLMQGPNATSGASSTLLFSEAQARYVADAVCRMADEGIRALDVRPEVEERWTRRIRRRSARTVYETGGCTSYYQNGEGHNVVMWPANTAEYQLRTRRFRLAPFHAEHGRTGAGRPLEPLRPVRLAATA